MRVYVVVRVEDVPKVTQKSRLCEQGVVYDEKGII